jgi:hypothetical protein
MSSFQKIFAWVCTVTLSTAFQSMSLAWAGRQGGDRSCTETHALEQLCATPYWVNFERGKPFIAERVSESKSASHSMKRIELVARDAAGRVRLEHHILEATSGHHDANTVTAPEADPGELVVNILDCFAGKVIQLRPNAQTAIVQQSCAEVSTFKQSDEPYTHQLNRFFGATLSPRISAVNLGDKEIDGVKARGVRLTELGTGRLPIRVLEEWLSDDLGVTLLWVDSDPLSQTETRITLGKIRKVEPDSSLFRIPAGCKVTEWK